MSKPGTEEPIKVDVDETEVKRPSHDHDEAELKFCRGREKMVLTKRSRELHELMKDQDNAHMVQVRNSDLDYDIEQFMIAHDNYH